MLWVSWVLHNHNPNSSMYLQAATKTLPIARASCYEYHIVRFIPQRGSWICPETAILILTECCRPHAGWARMYYCTTTVRYVCKIHIVDTQLHIDNNQAFPRPSSPHLALHSSDDSQVGSALSPRDVTMASGTELVLSYRITSYRCLVLCSHHARSI